MAIKISSDNERELAAAKQVFESGILNIGKLFLERNNLPTKLNVTYELLPRYDIIRHIIDKHNEKRERSTEDIRYIIIHVSCCPDPVKVFQSNTPVITNYVVTPKKVIMTSEDDHFPWALGDGRGDISNKNSISVMLVSSLLGKVEEESIELAALLVKDLLAKYKIPSANVIKYSDVKARKCTGDFDNTSVWHKFLKMIKD